jgi:hypothetical protein
MRNVTLCNGWFFFVVFSVSSLSAQVIDPSRRQEATLAPSAGPSLADSADLAQRSLEEENAFSPSSRGDDDIGQQLILKEVPTDQFFRAFADTFWLWTNNVANVPAGEVEDSFYGGRIGVGWQPRISNRTYVDVSLSQQMVRYVEFEALNFESLDASASLMHVAPALGNTLFFGSIVYNRITGEEFSQDLLQSTSARVGAQKSFLINRRNSIHLSVLGDWDLDTDVDQLFRDEYIGDIIYNFKISRTLVLALNYRFTWLEYRRVDRGDALQFAAATLSWQPKKWLEIYTTLNFAVNNSNVPAFDYETTSAGGGLGVRIKF